MSAYETSATLLADLPGVIAGRIGTVLPGLRECRGFVGRLNVEEVKRLGIAAPAVLVSRLRMAGDRTYAGPHRTYRLQMGAFILCKDELGLPRDMALANIAQALLVLADGNDWGLPDDVMPAEKLAEEPLVSVAAGRLAMSMSVVLWEQVVALSPFPAPEPVSPELYLGQAPRIGAAHEGDYERIGDGA